MLLQILNGTKNSFIAIIKKDGKQRKGCYLQKPLRMRQKPIERLP